MIMSSNLNSWLEAIRLRTLPLALASIAMGTFLAAAEGYFNILILLLAAVTTIFLQILSNLANDYGDTIHGADSIHRHGPARSVQSGAISAKSMKNAIIVVTLVSFVSGISLLFVSIEYIDIAFLLFTGLGVCAILAALGYTIGKHPYGYAGLGDLFVIIFFGFIGVLGTCYLFSGKLITSHIMPALSSGLFATAVLNINNIRDIESDTKAGKKSIPVRIGRKRAVIYHWILLFSGFLLAVIYMLEHYESPFQLLFFLSLPLFIKNGVEVKYKRIADDLDPSLKKMAISTLIFTILFGIGLLF
jgi:1,4-dihydroxy-2-naphthoate octaprenyltransferase